jgi:uncharacterized protein YecE (DUF72 family)
MGALRIGTCSWTDKTMVKAWYPSGVSTAEARLRYYAARFGTVEVDASFYAVPEPRVAAAWVERTPPGFVFHVKAYGMMTGHAVRERSLPPMLRGFEHDNDAHGRVVRPHADMVDSAFDVFLDAIEPLKESGKLGGILMQYPPYFTAVDPEHTRRNLEYLEYCRSKLAGYRMLVEFRHPSWVLGGQLERTLRFLRERRVSYVSVDAPQFAGRLTMPPIARVTSDLGYVRFHGRNTETYFARTASAADRFDYVYAPEELAEWEAPLRQLASESEVTYAMFNNCRHDYAPRNAAQLTELLADIADPVPGSSGGAEEEGTLF